jgi:signal transduction histidine kinase/CheY-like chemotaxis protein/HPt (histidine-containing phosphotransfer) domain-containing protein
MLLVWFGIGTYLVQKYEFQLGDAAQDSRNLAHAFEENIRRTIEAIDTTTRALRIARAHDPAHFDVAGWARDSGLAQELTLQISVSDRNGTVIGSNLGLNTGTPASIADRPHFRTPRDAPGDTLFISTPVLGRVSGRWSVQFVRKLFDAHGAFDGVVVASLDPSFLSRFYTSLDIGQGALLLLGQDGIVRSAGPQTVAVLGTDLSVTPLMSEASVEAFGTVRMAATADGIERVYSWRRVDPYGLQAVVGLSVGDALEPFYSDRKGAVAIGLGLTILTLVISVVLAHSRRDSVRSQAMLRAAVENISQGLIVIDEQRRVPVLNARAVELLEMPLHLSTPGFEFDSLLEWQLEAGEFDGQDDAAVRRLVESGGIERGSNVYRRTRRNGVVLEIRTKVLDSGLAVRTYTDITDQQRAAQVLAEARDSAEAAVRARSELLAVMSHEIRTPLNGVIGVAGLLEVMELEPVQREYVRLIRQSGDHLLELINDILDYSRLEADRVELEEVPFDPRILMQSVADMFLTQAGSKGLHLSARVDGTVPTMLLGDPGRLRQVLVNLVGNAVKFTDQGWVTLALAHEPEVDGCIRLLFSVTDSGIGIAPDAIDRMFEEFTQMDGSISRRFGGSGLGLAISRRLVEVMGGSIGVDSQLGKGSTFRFDVTLKLGQAVVPATADMELETGTPLRILLAEDNATNRLVAARLLERLGHRADTVSNGQEVIAALERSQYDLILMDVMMPEMDGLTATRRIRATEADGARIPIVALTAGSGTERLAACLDAGMDAVTTKPVTLACLRSAIGEGRRAAASHTMATGSETTTARLRELAEMLGEDAVAEIARTFVEDTNGNLAAIRDAASRDDHRMVGRIAHSIAGAARNVGADALAARGSALEETAGLMGTAQLALEIAALQTDLDAVIDRLGIKAAAA